MSPLSKWGIRRSDLVALPSQFLEIDCEHVWKELTNYIEGDVSQEMRDRITRHLKQCRDCTGSMTGPEMSCSYWVTKSTSISRRVSASVFIIDCWLNGSSRGEIRFDLVAKQIDY